MYHRPLDFRGIAHDINNVVARASLASESLRDHPDPAVATQARRIGAAMQEVSTICRQQMSASLVQIRHDLCLGPDLERLIRRVAEMSGARGAGIGVRLDVDDRARLRCHSSSLMRILFNLTINAVKAMSGQRGGTIEIAARRHGAQMHFVVTDDGPGMPAGLLDRLFPGPCTASKPIGRLGTGLYVAASLARAMGGELLLMESSTRGTRFQLTLPADAAPTAGAPTPLTQAEECAAS